MRFILSVLKTLSSRNSCSQSGFILLEMTIALIVIGLIGTLSFPLITKYIEYSRWQKTEKHQELVLQSLKNYLFMHHHLPCPADPGKPGIAKTICQKPQESIGIIPYRTLSLPLSSVKDGFNYFMTYAVNPYLTNAQGQNFCQNQEPIIQVFSKNKDESVFNPEKSCQESGKTASDVIAFVIISYGPKGVGSFLTEAAKEREKMASSSISSQEEQNINPITLGDGNSSGSKKSETNVSITFYTQPYSTNPDQLFRHKIVWATQKFFGGFCQNQQLKESILIAAQNDKKLNQEIDNLKNPPPVPPLNPVTSKQNPADNEHGLDTSTNKDLPPQNSDSMANTHGLNNFSRRSSSQKTSSQ